MKYRMIDELGVSHTVFFEQINSEQGRLRIKKKLYDQIAEKAKRLGAWDQLTDPMIIVSQEQTLHVWISNPLPAIEGNEYTLNAVYTIYDDQAEERKGI